jgi:hypothetical protein
MKFTLHFNVLAHLLIIKYCYNIRPSFTFVQEEFEDTKVVIISHKSKEGQKIQFPKETGQKDKQWLPRYYT